MSDPAKYWHGGILLSTFSKLSSYSIIFHWSTDQFYVYLSHFLTYFSTIKKDKPNFFPGNDLLAYENVNLVLDGIDTFALVQLNKANVTFTENMFRQYVLDVRKYLNVSDFHRN